MGGKISHATQCSKSRELAKFIDLIIDIESFKQKRVIIKGLLHSDRIKQHVATIGIYQLLSNCAM